LSEANPKETRAFTVAFDVGEYDESRFARAAVERFGVAHTECRVTPEDILALIPKLAEIYDEPFANHSTVPTYYCARFARDQGVEVMLAGDGGDEIFAGNTRYLEDAIFDHYRRIPRAVRLTLLEPIAAVADQLRWIPVFRKIANYAQIGRMSIPERMNRSNLFSRVDAKLVFEPDFFASIDRSNPLRLAEEIYEASPSPSEVKKMMHLDLRITLADGDLRKVNRMCELAGVRVRYPFLDDDVVAFSGRVPDRLMVEGGKLRAFFKKAVTGFLPDMIINKDKHGFGLPFIEYADRSRPLVEFICDSVTALKRRHIFRDAYLDRMIACHRGEANGMHRGDIWDLMMIELWHRHHVDGGASSGAADVRPPVPVAAT
jgi:asparagine synthase (glutamine-hydrolysing)